MSVRRAQAEIDAAEFAEWSAWFKLQREEEDRDDAIAPKPTAKPRQTPEQMAAIFSAFAQVHNERVAQGAKHSS